MEHAAMEVHAAADIFPMLSEEELNQLAADIAANGLINPIVVKNGVLIDGRNRLEACRRAGVEPTFTELNGADPAAFILSANINRRHMTTGQRAMAVARLFPDPVAHRGKTSEAAKVFKSENLSDARVSQARAIVQWAPELADSVLTGATPLSVAYATAADRKATAEAPTKRLNALRASDPDLADKVVEEALKIEDAEGAARDRRNRERAARQGMYDALQAMERYLFVFEEPSQRAEFVRIVNEHPNEISRDDVLKSLSGWSDAIGKTIGELTNA